MTQQAENKEVLNENPNTGFVLNKKNYILLTIGFVLILVGYFLISGGRSEDPNVFNPEIFSFRRITLAPIIIIIGFVIEIFAIMLKFQNKK